MKTPTKQNTIDILKQFSVALGACISILTGIFFFTKGNINDYIEARIIEYHSGNDHKVNDEALIGNYIKSPQFEKVLIGYLQDTNSNSISFRKLLADELGIREHQVVGKIASLFRVESGREEEYQKNKQRLYKALRLLNRLYPEADVWITD